MIIKNRSWDILIIGGACGNWLKDECTKLRIPIVEPRPWNTLINRVIDLIY